MLKENASTVYFCQDGYTDSKLGGVWAWRPSSQQTVDQWGMVAKLDLTLPCLFSSLADVECWMLLLEKQVYKICGREWIISEQPLPKFQEQST